MDRYIFSLKMSVYLSLSLPFYLFYPLLPMQFKTDIYEIGPSVFLIKK